MLIRAPYRCTGAGTGGRMRPGFAIAAGRAYVFGGITSRGLIPLPPAARGLDIALCVAGARAVICSVPKLFRAKASQLRFLPCITNPWLISGAAELLHRCYSAAGRAQCRCGRSSSEPMSTRQWCIAPRRGKINHSVLVMLR